MLELAQTLSAAGHEVWCVGGAVRDAMLGISHLDWDLATSAHPPVVQKLFRRTIPVGLKFGTVGVLDRNGRMHEVTTFRRDIRTDGRHAEVEFGASLNDDLARRDFTINAMAWDPLAERLEDPFDGQGDLERQLVRAVGRADDRFTEDRLRALRAIRFAARFGFRIESQTWSAIRDSAPHLGRLSAERVKQELDKTMEQVSRPSVALIMWQQSGAFRALVPDLAEASARQFLAVDALPAPGLRTRPLRRTLRFAALFAAVPVGRLPASLKALKFSNLEITAIVALAGSWAELGPSLGARLQQPEPLRDEELRPWAARIGRLRVSAFVRLAAAHWWADAQLGQAAPDAARWRTLYRRLVQVAFRDPLELGDLVVNGDDLRRAGIAAGPVLGIVLKGLVAFVLADPARNDEHQLLDEARRLAAQRVD